jgi:hypothetical protein
MKRWLVLLIICVGYGSANAQMFETPEHISTFSSRVNSPVTLRVEHTGNTFVFYAENKSYYPYNFELSFTKLVNLTPRTAGEKRILKHGSSRILKLTIENEELAPDYGYSISYSMGDPSRQADESFPYLMPISPGKKFERHSTIEDGRNVFLINAFKLAPGDTIYAIRKGFVAALPEENHQIDKLHTGALEIIHEDGSVALYRNITRPLLKYNQEVYPGQPVGIVEQASFFIVSVHAFTESQVKALSIKFVSEDQNLFSFRDLPPGQTVQHPVNIIEKELSAKEIKKLKKSKN